MKGSQMWGPGTLIKTNGDIFHGEFADGKQNGSGQLLKLSGDLYQGYWTDNVLNGHGVIIMSER